MQPSIPFSGSHAIRSPAVRRRRQQGFESLRSGPGLRAVFLRLLTVTLAAPHAAQSQPADIPAIDGIIAEASRDFELRRSGDTAYGPALFEERFRNSLSAEISRDLQLVTVAKNYSYFSGDSAMQADTVRVFGHHSRSFRKGRLSRERAYYDNGYWRHFTDSEFEYKTASGQTLVTETRYTGDSMFRSGKVMRSRTRKCFYYAAGKLHLEEWLNPEGKKEKEITYEAGPDGRIRQTITRYYEDGLLSGHCEQSRRYTGPAANVRELRITDSCLFSGRFSKPELRQDSSWQALRWTDTSYMTETFRRDYPIYKKSLRYAANELLAADLSGFADTAIRRIRGPAGEEIHLSIRERGYQPLKEYRFRYHNDASGYRYELINASEWTNPFGQQVRISSYSITQKIKRQ